MDILNPTSIESLAIVLAEQLYQTDLTEKWWAVSKAAEKYEARLIASLKDLFAEQEKEVLRRVNSRSPGKGIKAPGDAWLFDPKEWQPVFENAGKPVIVGALLEGGNTTLADLGMGVNFNATRPEVQEFIAKKVPKFSFDVNETTLNDLRREFKAGLDAGEGIKLIEKRVEKVFGFTEKFRNKRIAQTEIMGAMNKGGHEGLVQSGVVKEKVWISTRDNLTRDSHRKMDGEHVPLKQKYSNGLMYPGDWTGRAEEIINCRCTDTAYSFN